MTWSMRCPSCSQSLGPLPPDDPDTTVMPCSACGLRWTSTRGVWRMLPTDRAAHYAQFLQDYLGIRLSEGRGSDDPEYYRRLPDPTPGHPMAWQWTIRSATWRHLHQRVLPRLGANLQVLDLGAGVGWLSHRLAQLGHRPMAIDVLTDERDGLEAAHHYGLAWPRVQAEFDRLPLVDASVDVVIYNASLHYSTDYGLTLDEARRVVRPGGHIIVLETPIYRHEHSGQAMVAERHQQFAERYGTRSESIPSIEYLTDDRLATLGRQFGLHWQQTTPWYGWAWWWRPYRARLRRTREPSRFQILTAEV